MSSNIVDYKPSMQIFYEGIKTFASFYKPENNWDEFNEYCCSSVTWVTTTIIDNIHKHLRMTNKYSDVSEVKVYIDESEEFCKAVEDFMDDMLNRSKVTIRFPFKITISKMIKS